MIEIAFTSLRGLGRLGPSRVPIVFISVENLSRNFARDSSDHVVNFKLARPQSTLYIARPEFVVLLLTRPQSSLAL